MVLKIKGNYFMPSLPLNKNVYYLVCETTFLLFCLQHPIYEHKPQIADVVVIGDYNKFAVISRGLACVPEMVIMSSN